MNISINVLLKKIVNTKVRMYVYHEGAVKCLDPTGTRKSGRPVTYWKGTKEPNTEKGAEKLETGWQIFERIIKEMDSGNLRLKSLDVMNRGMDTDVIQRLKRALPKKEQLIHDKKGRNYEDQTTSCCLFCK